jgi:hypothetical protein
MARSTSLLSSMLMQRKMGKPSISSAVYRQFYNQKRKGPVYVSGHAGVETQEIGGIFHTRKRQPCSTTWSSDQEKLGN